MCDILAQTPDEVPFVCTVLSIGAILAFVAALIVGLLGFLWGF